MTAVEVKQSHKAEKGVGNISSTGFLFHYFYQSISVTIKGGEGAVGEGTCKVAMVTTLYLP